jgi:hypothetical protein
MLTYETADLRKPNNDFDEPDTSIMAILNLMLETMGCLHNTVQLLSHE